MQPIRGSYCGSYSSFAAYTALCTATAGYGLPPIGDPAASGFGREWQSNPRFVLAWRTESMQADWIQLYAHMRQDASLPLTLSTNGFGLDRRHCAVTTGRRIRSTSDEHGPHWDISQLALPALVTQPTRGFRCFMSIASHPTRNEHSHRNSNPNAGTVSSKPATVA
ncbi:hypothetical protein F4824DRAFT_511119 [Ustulina deusta]|nr:hypothetical protein F4824DRAFT_511119 [Ustulina deusta]